VWSDHCHSTFLQTRREYVCSYPPHLEVFGCVDEALGCGATLVTLHFYRQEANTSAATSHTWKCLDALMGPSSVERSLSLYISTGKTRARSQLPPTPESVRMR
jgi:hypothetical protein